jgi:YHS domain-containing protein
MKKLLSLVAIACVAIASAQKAPDKTPTEIACPIMPDHKVNIAKATKEKMFSDYKGRRYFFCCGGCPGAFKANPAKYAKAASIPTPAPAKKKG